MSDNEEQVPAPSKEDRLLISLWIHRCLAEQKQAREEMIDSIQESNHV